MNIPPADINTISAIWQRADVELRVKASSAPKRVRDENTHTVQFLMLVEGYLKAANFSVIAQQLTQSDERRYGCDAIFVILYERQLKIMLMEAKLPRILNSRNSTVWDSTQGKNGPSHFSSQLQRQSKLTDDFAITEIFYVHEPEHLQDKNFFDKGASWVWSDKAIAADPNRNTAPAPWNAGELRDLLNLHKITCGEAIKDFLRCNAGKPLDGRYLNHFEWLREYGIETDYIVTVDLDDKGRGTRQPNQGSPGEQLLSNEPSVSIGELDEHTQAALVHHATKALHER
jgi:hypothetical protein